MEISQKGPVKAGCSQAVEIPGTRAKCLGLELQERFFALGQPSDLQSGKGPLAALKSARLTWDNTFSLHGPCTFNLCRYYGFYCHLLSFFFYEPAPVF